MRPKKNLIRRIAEQIGPGPHLNFNVVMAACREEAERLGVKLTAKRITFLKSELTETDEAAEPVIKKIHKPGKIDPDPLHGLFEIERDGKLRVMEYEPDTSLRDTEQVPLLEDGGIEAFFLREVLPYAPDAWIDSSKTRIGYEISFTRHFYTPKPLRSLDEIRADLLTLQKESEGLLEQIIRGATA